MQDTPKNLDQKRADEKMLVSEMIALYCRRQLQNTQRQPVPGVPAAARLRSDPH